MTRVNIAQPDVTLHLDLKGVIQDVSHSANIPDGNFGTWLGLPWIDTVTARTGKDAIQRIVKDACATGVSAFRQIVQRLPSGEEVAIEYTAVRLGENGGLIAVGRNLQAVSELESRLVAAQEAMERDYWALREIETRYQLLFDTSSDAVIVVRADDLRISEANPAAIRALGLAPVGRDFLSELTSKERKSFRAMLLRVRESGKAPGIILHLGREREAWMLRASLITSDTGTSYLLQLSPVEVAQPQASPAVRASLEDVMDRCPDGFVVVDGSGAVLRANKAFLDIVQIAAEQSVLGKSMAKWLSRPGADIKVLISNVIKLGSVIRFSTSVQGELGTEVPVEISAVGAGDRVAPQYALWVRDAGQRLSKPAEDSGTDTLLESLTEQIGTTPLRELVKRTTSIVERHYIDSALDLTKGNRTAAAEVLGVSRQSLHNKLNQYSIDRNPQKPSQYDE